MSKRKHGLGLLGLLAVTALGMMAFASSALALETQFHINLKAATAALDLTFVGTQEGRGTLEIPGLNTEINCESGELTGGLIATALDAKIAKILFKECTALSISKLLVIAERELPCHVSDVHAGAPTQLHVTALTNILALPVEISAGPPVQYGVLAENISVFVNFLSGTGCPLPLKTEVKGEVCFLITAATNDTPNVLIHTDSTIQKSCPEVNLPPNGVKKDTLLYGAQEAFIKGSGILTLTGPAGDENKPWGVLLL